MDNSKRLTLEALVAKAEQRRQEKFETHQVEVPSLGGALQLEKIPLTRIASMMDDLGDTSMAANLAFNVDLIYACCPMLRNTKLQAAYEGGGAYGHRVRRSGGQHDGDQPDRGGHPGHVRPGGRHGDQRRGKKLIKGDADLAVIAHYLNRGHSLEELLGMTFLERMFLLAAWELEVDALNGQ